MPDSTVPSTASRQHAALGHALSELRGCACPDCASERDELRRINDGLDKLRKAVKGCGASLGIWLSDMCDGRPGWLCFACEAKRDAAIALLLGNTGEEHELR